MILIPRDPDSGGGAHSGTSTFNKLPWDSGPKAGLGTAASGTWLGGSWAQKTKLDNVKERGKKQDSACFVASD